MVEHLNTGERNGIDRPIEIQGIGDYDTYGNDPKVAENILKVIDLKMPKFPKGHIIDFQCGNNAMLGQLVLKNGGNLDFGEDSRLIGIDEFEKDNEIQSDGIEAYHGINTLEFLRSLPDDSVALVYMGSIGEIFRHDGNREWRKLVTSELNRIIKSGGGIICIPRIDLDTYGLSPEEFSRPMGSAFVKDK